MSNFFQLSSVYFSDSVRTGRARLSICFVHQFVSSARHAVGVFVGWMK